MVSATAAVNPLGVISTGCAANRRTDQARIVACIGAESSRTCRPCADTVSAPKCRRARHRHHGDAVPFAVARW